MYSLLGSLTKEKILKYLVKHPYSKMMEISKATGVTYKNTYKIMKELQEKEIVLKKNHKFYLKSDFIAYIKKLSNGMLRNYSKEVLFRNKFDLYNTLSSTYVDKKISSKIDKLMDTWITQKLDDWYSKYYDPENLEYTELKKEILSNHKKDYKILEVGCGTGRLTFKLAKDFKKVVAIDNEKINVDYCKKKSSNKRIDFAHSTASNFESKEKFDIILLSWIGLHYQEDFNEILEALEKVMKKNSKLIILDAYYGTEYVKILQMIRKRDLNEVKLKKEKVNTYLIKKFENLKQNVFFTKYKFPSIEELINNFKIELTLEESHVWTQEDEDKIKQYLHKKKDPLIVQEGFWMTVVTKKSTD